ncbi:MAG: TonB-dependent receptor [Saprospiraceae bacterium]|nr:TonB-dependent receptor [Saprospiraceae bacterium]
MKIIKLFFSALILITHSLSAQVTDSATLLNDVVIKENRLQMRFSEASRSIEIISRKQIETAPIQSLAEMLNYFSGVDVRQRGVHGIQPDVTIRGGTFDQVLILINGTKLTDPQTGHHALNLPLNLENIERVEILKGPAARIYGQNAFTGAINIVTRENTVQGTPFGEGVVSGGIQAGDFNLWSGKLSFSNVSKHFSQNISLSHDQSDGYRPNSDYKISNVFYQNTMNLKGQKINFLGGFTERKFGASGFYNSTNTSNEREFIQTNFVAIDAPLSINGLKLTPRVSWRRNQDEYFFDYSTETTRANTRNWTLTQVLSAELNGNYDSKIGTTGLSIEYNDAKFFNKRLGDHARTMWSGFLEHRFRFFNERLDITPGILLAHYSDYGSNSFPGIDVGFRVHDNVKVFANYGKTYRVPTFTDLYFFNAANNNNPNLLPEKANSYEFGAKFINEFLSVQMAFFERNSLNLIDRTKNLATEKWTPTNLNSLLLRGIDGSVSARFKVLNGLNLTASYLKITDNEFTKIQTLSRYALDFLTEQFTFSEESGIVSKLRQNIRVRHAKRYNQAEPYTVTDAKLIWLGEKMTYFVQASNIFDTVFTEQNNIPMPKRWFSAGVNFRFKY